MLAEVNFSLNILFLRMTFVSVETFEMEFEKNV